ncbi:MAG: hypothetical protein GF308_16660 [Candidatus Heimdallarchaeota archaeon]|nr:hypothetical protein [Candidatus Heimdallarchaeota archaeon]
MKSSNWYNQKRVRVVRDYLRLKNIDEKRSDIRKLTGPTQYADEFPDIEVIVLSPETYDRLLKINEIRRKKS